MLVLRTLVAAFLIAVLGLPLGSARAAPADGGSADGDPVLLTLLHTNDMHARVHPADQSKGLARIATLIRQVRRDMPHVLLLDAGDSISGQPAAILFGGKGMIRAMNAAGYTAMTVGNHEFDRGHETAERTLALAQFPILSANVVDKDSGQPWKVAKPYIVREIDGLRVAIFGLTTPRTLDFEWERSMGNLTVLPPVATARKLVPRLRKQEDADVVILVSHIGLDADKQVAQAVEGIDVILGGHSHTTLDKQVWVNGTLIMQTGSHAQALGRVDLLARPDGQGEYTITINGQDGRWWGHDGAAALRIDGKTYDFPDHPLTPVSEEIPLDEQVMAAYRPFEEKTNEHLAEVVADLPEVIAGQGSGEDDTPLGNLLADAVREAKGTDVGVFAVSQFHHGALGPGPVTIRDLYGIMGAYTRQHIAVVRTPGRHLRAMLREAIGPGDVKLQVSNVRIGPNRILVGGEPLEDDQIYTVAAAIHILEDYLIGKPGVEVTYDDPLGTNVRQATAAYLRAHRHLQPPATDRI